MTKSPSKQLEKEAVARLKKTKEDVSLVLSYIEDLRNQLRRSDDLLEKIAKHAGDLAMPYWKPSCRDTQMQYLRDIITSRRDETEQYINDQT